MDISSNFTAFTQDYTNRRTRRMLQIDTIAAGGSQTDAEGTAALKQETVRRCVRTPTDQQRTAVMLRDVISFYYYTSTTAATTVGTMAAVLRL